VTAQLFRDDPYLRDAEARFVRINERGGIVLDRTNFYAASGGQPGDAGRIEIAGHGQVEIATAVYDADRATIVHVPKVPLPAAPAEGTAVRTCLDWELRHRHMRMHTALHLLCAIVRFPVTGGQIGAAEGRLDFDIADADAVDKDELTRRLNALVTANHPVSERWITDSELATNPGLVRTMAVKPPMGSGRVRLVLIGEGGGVDMQPCGGTHVRATGEIGPLAVLRIEKKGKQNRRIRVAFA
jgi:misacylated tRNA(Ala) deacylase